MSSAVIELSPMGDVVREHCPHCDAAVPHDAIKFGRWRPGTGEHAGYDVRTVTLRCPRCDEVSRIVVRR